MTVSLHLALITLAVAFFDGVLIGRMEKKQ